MSITIFVNLTINFGLINLNFQDNNSTGDVAVSNGNESNGNGDIPSLKDLSAEVAAVIDPVNGRFA